MNAYALAALPPTLLLIARPELWPWALTVAAFVALAAVGAAAHHFRTERDDAIRNADALGRELAAVLDEHALCPAPVRPTLRVVSQRDGSEYEWPRLAREIENDDLTALMRATEEK